MKKAVYAGLFILLLAVIYFILESAFPKYVWLMPFIIVLMGLDGYLWLSVRKWILSKKTTWKILLVSLYWLPLAGLMILVIVGMFSPFGTWNIPFRTISMGIIAMVYVAKIFPVITLLLADLVRIGQCIIDSFINGFDFHVCSIKKQRWLTLTGWITGSLVFLALLYGMIFTVYDFRIKRVTISIPELPASFEGMKIVQFSDAHLGSWDCRDAFASAMLRIDLEKPDVIFFTGDIANYSTQDVSGFIPELKLLRARNGIFTILGNHDYGDYITWPSDSAKQKDFDSLGRIYKYLGWHFLRNQHFILKRGNDSIVILGVENWGYSKRFQRRGSVAEALSGVENVPVKLLLSHDPSYWEKIISRKFPEIDITFSGHTHGYQFGIDNGKILWSPFMFMSTYWAGLYSKPVKGSHPQYLYVNEGLGSLGYPGRIGMRPEITVFTITR
jgi:uncharacterized protein